MTETIECLTLDALGGSAPDAWIVLTAREHLTRPELNEHLRVIRQRLKRDGWSVEWFVTVEFQRRGALHANLLVKGVSGRVEEFFAAIASVWCSRVDALPVGQWADAILQEKGGAYAVTRYVSKTLGHGLKREQAAPLGWQGHRTSHTRGYFGRAMWEVRAEARASLQRKRELWKAEEGGADPEQAEAIAAYAIEQGRARRWELVAVSVDEDGELLRVRPAAGGGVREAMRSPRASDHLRVADALWELRKLRVVELRVAQRRCWPDETRCQRVDAPQLFPTIARRE